MTGAVSPLLQAGLMQLHWDATGLRHLSWDGAEVLAALYVAVRDENWGTVVGTVMASEPAEVPGGRGVRWTVRHDDGEVRFTWHGLLRAWPSGQDAAELAFEMDGVAGGDFRACRIGVCLLHPLSLAGHPAHTRQSGQWHPGRFPAAVAPDAPFTGFDALRHAVPGGGTAEIILGGGLFEMEDQRNWTDASFKTYSPPLREPFPRQVTAGQRIRQAVTLRLRAQAAAARAATPPAAPRRAARGDRLALHLAAPRPGSGPAQQRLPALGIGLAPPDVPISETDRALLREARPRHLHAAIDTARPAWAAELADALSQASSLRCRTDLEVVAGDAGEVQAVARALAQAAGAYGRVGPAPVGRVFVYDRARSQTTRELAAAWAAATGTPPGGGSRANYAELNRADLPAGLLSAVAFAVNPQVHAFDDESVMQTLVVQPLVTRDAIARAGGLPVIVGPVTLRPRFNAAATGPPRPRPPGSPPPAGDPRQATAFAAAWTAGSIAALAPSGASALTYFETAGACGVLAGTAELPAGYPAPGAVYPAYHVLALLAPLSGAPLIPVTSADPAVVATLGVATPSGPLVVLANLSPAEVPVRLDGAPGGQVRRLPGSVGPPREPPVQTPTTAGMQLALSPWEVVAVGSLPPPAS
jgi:D-apionolactonase